MLLRTRPPHWWRLYSAAVRRLPWPAVVYSRQRRRRRRIKDPPSAPAHRPSPTRTVGHASPAAPARTSRPLQASASAGGAVDPRRRRQLWKCHPSHLPRQASTCGGCPLLPHAAAVAALFAPCCSLSGARAARPVAPAAAGGGRRVRCRRSWRREQPRRQRAGGCSAQREALPARFSRFRPSLSTDAVGQRTESGRGRTYRCRRGTARCQAPRGDVAVVQVRAAAAPRKRWGEGGVPQPPPFGVTQAVATRPVGVGGPCGTARPAVTKYGQPRLFAPVMRLVRTQTGAELDGIAHSASNAPPQTPHQTRTVQRPHPPPPHPPSPPTKMVLSRGAGR